MTRRALSAAVALLLIAAFNRQLPHAQQAVKAGERRQFLTCPIVRDTKTQPCWLAEYEGQLYYLGQQSGVAGDFYPPQLGHQALVEGTVGEGRVCGGIPLQPVKVSVMRELTPACNTMLPAEDGIDAPPPVPSPRGPAPSWVKIADPSNVTLYFDFDNDFLSVHVTTALTNVAKHALDVKATRVEVTGYRAATHLSSGQTLTERADMGGIRARKVAGVLAGLGVPAANVIVSAPESPERADGVNDPWNRRVVIRVQ